MRLITKVLLVTRVISEKGRWPGQTHILGASLPTRPTPAGNRPLRWPGQSRLTASSTRPEGPSTAPWAVWDRVRDALFGDHGSI
jgi:hypothetical protein